METMKYKKERLLKTCISFLKKDLHEPAAIFLDFAILFKVIAIP